MLCVGMASGGENMIAEHRELGDVELLIWGLQLKLDQLEAGQEVGALNLKVPAFGRSDVGWPTLRAGLESNRLPAAPEPGVIGWLQRAARRVLLGRGTTLAHERVAAFQSQALGALDHFFARLELAEGEAEQVSRQLLELRQSLGDLGLRVHRLEEKFDERRPDRSVLSGRK